MQQTRRTTAQRIAFRSALTRACSGRENHADSFTLLAVDHRATGYTRIEWSDELTDEGGELGRIPIFDAGPIVADLFTQVRAWRSRCEMAGQTMTRYAAAAAAGGRA